MGLRGIYFGLSFHLSLSFVCVSDKGWRNSECVISQTVEPSLLVYEISKYYNISWIMYCKLGNFLEGLVS